MNWIIHILFSAPHTLPTSITILLCTLQAHVCVCVCVCVWGGVRVGVCACVCATVGGHVHACVCVCVCVGGVGGGLMCKEYVYTLLSVNKNNSNTTLCSEFLAFLKPFSMNYDWRMLSVTNTYVNTCVIKCNPVHYVFLSLSLTKKHWASQITM